VVPELNSEVASKQPEQHVRSGQALRDSEARYRRLFETAQDGILILDAQKGSITDVNPYLMKLLDYSREEFLGKALWDIGLFGDIEASKETFKELQAKQYVRYEDLPLKTKAGQTINVEFVSNVYGVNGEQVIQCNIRDITKRKHAERSEQRILQAQKMEAIGQLAGGVAHDFNNLLGVILGYCELLADRDDLAEPARQMIGKISTAGLSAKNLTQGLLAFSRRQVLQPVVMDLNEAVDHIHPMIERLIGDDIELDNVLSDDLGTITADPNHIEQVLMNLAINARDAMPTGGTITFETTNVEIDEAYAQQHVPMKPGRYVMLSVRDTGTGMDLETQAQIFDPFFTTKDFGKGTGLGLSTVFGIVKQSGGTIGVYSEPGKGTAFKIHFPRCDEAPVIVEPIKPKQLRGGTETILLVDDATPLRMLTKLILEQCGYTVLDSGEPAEALRIADGHKGPLPLMITDVVMPGFTGRVLAERLAVDRPETKVLFTSGYADDATAEQGVFGADSAFLEKPFTRDDLVRKVRELLDLPRQTKQVPRDNRGSVIC
jgi:two-component system, cell cycle sensor histidine kinase and response regulator CckA